MKKKVYKFEDGKKNDAYIREIKDIMRNNPNAETEAGFDENGCYVIKVMTPDWRDKLGFKPSVEIKGKIISEDNMYGNYQDSKKYQKYMGR